MISIIIPVYNTQAYIRHCLDSVIAQSERNWECICVDDGSSDDAPRIIEEYAQSDARIKLIKQGNRGVSVARNVALRLAQGDYITFLDSDDYLHPRMLEWMRHLADTQKLDCLACRPTLTPYVRVEELAVPDIEQAKLEMITQPASFILRENPPNFSCCGKLYRHDCIRGVRFPEGISFEDGPWLLEALSRVEKLAYTDLPLIYFYERTQSATRSSWNEQKTSDILDSIRCFLQLESRHDTAEFSSVAQACVAHWLRVLLYNIRIEQDKKYRKKLWRDCIPKLQEARREGALPMGKLKLRHRLVLYLLLSGVSFL